ncbi:hypothetical protein FE257_010937 [Aspergillus nanangensis]|uniref:P-loop containing nucleoside triphosphate hydrolase protein n=1 Tax=Aspergillus nanangensis TaxID=2582783 RepID=A0AAD4CVS2_ASPNN|nr:hypothetical protein FE257_010937 [Aspergillus nanangensis]
MEVLALGMGRSGTDSLGKALSILGYDRVYHGFDMGFANPPSWEAWVKLARRKWGGKSSPGTPTDDIDITLPDLDSILGDCAAVTGSAVARIAPEMVQACPNAKVILNMRDSGKWLQSARNTFGVINVGFKYRVLPYFHAQLYWRKRYYEEMLHTYFYGSLVKNGKWVYEEHCAKIRGLVPQGQLLEWRAEDGWEPLCRFLGKDIPDQDFPWGNRPDQMISSIGNMYMNDMYKAACLNMCWIAMGCLGASAAVYLYFL